MEIKSVGVIGAGTMGNGIAHVFAKGGYEVVLVDVEQRFLDRGVETIRKNLEREVDEGENHGGSSRCRGRPGYSDGGPNAIGGVRLRG